MKIGTPRVPRPNLEAYERAGKIPSDISIAVAENNRRVMATIGSERLLAALHGYYVKMGWPV